MTTNTKYMPDATRAHGHSPRVDGMEIDLGAGTIPAIQASDLCAAHTLIDDEFHVAIFMGNRDMGAAFILMDPEEALAFAEGVIRSADYAKRRLKPE